MYALLTCVTQCSPTADAYCVMEAESLLIANCSRLRLLLCVFHTTQLCLQPAVLVYSNWGVDVRRFDGYDVITSDLEGYLWDVA